MKYLSKLKDFGCTMLLALLLFIVPLVIHLMHLPQSLESKEDQSYIIYKDLIKYTGEPENAPIFQVIGSTTVNAWYDGTSIVITTAMLDRLENKDQIAAVLGHELGHAMLRHVLYEDDQRAKEMAADRYSVYLMLRAGYNICQVRGVWLKFLDNYGDGILTESHPSYSQRAYEFDFPVCGQIFNK